MIDLQNLPDPFVQPGTDDRREDGMYVWTLRNGVKVESTIPRNSWRWWDYTVTHPLWSWTSWITMILAMFGYIAKEEKDMPRLGDALSYPRKYLKRRGWW